ncbi:hypothetical protein, partial [Pedobacter glucosidilyticus]|uniref:hypothetical protein n=1 Tax=Pedobacter glucosidilyticus TaxID=1122941 RepID=UPI0026EAC446
MEQLEYNHTKEIRFSDYLLDLQKLNESKLADLESLIHKYPYCQTLYLLATKAAQNTSAFNQKLTQAATILPDRTALHHIIHHPEKLNKDYSSLELAEEKEVTQEALVSIIQEDLSPENNLVETPAELKQETVESHEEVPSPAAESFVHEDEVYEEIADVVLEHIIPTVNPVEEENDINLNVSTSSEMVVEEPSIEHEELPLNIDEEISAEAIETATPSVSEEEEKVAAAAAA